MKILQIIRNQKDLIKKAINKMKPQMVDRLNKENQKIQQHKQRA